MVTEELAGFSFLFFFCIAKSLHAVAIYTLREQTGFSQGLHDRLFSIFSSSCLPPLLERSGYTEAQAGLP